MRVIDDGRTPSSVQILEFAKLIVNRLHTASTPDNKKIIDENIEEITDEWYEALHDLIHPTL